LSFLKEFENFGPKHGWNDHTFPEQDTSLFNRAGLLASLEAFELRPVGVLAENFEVRPAGLNEILH
jgi:hypothetical protein